MEQFNDRNVVHPPKRSQIFPKIRNKASGYLMFLQTVEIKSRGCGGGIPQRIYKLKMENSCPTVATESIIITSAIDTKGRRDIVRASIPGLFLQTEINKGTIVKLQGILVDTIEKVNPKWKEFIIYEGKKKVRTICS